MSLDESIADIDRTGYPIGGQKPFECSGRPIKINPDPYYWTDEGGEARVILVIATVPFEGAQTVIDLPDQPFCYALDSLWTLVAIPADNLPEWARP